MTRYRSDFDDERDYRLRDDRFDRERPWNYTEFPGRSPREYDRRELGQGRFGERAEYEYNEPRYNDYSSRRHEEDSARSSYEGRDYQQGARYDRATRSRLRVRDIMTRELAVATRDTPITEVARMMKEEDTGVIPVVDFASNGNGKATGDDRRLNTGSYGQGKLIGLITDRDIVIRAVADGKDCGSTRAEDVMSTDVYTARPHERVVDAIRKMGDKQVRRIPVISESGNLRGIVSMGDIAVETEADRELGEALEEISRTSSFWGKIFG
ncbi:MAG TPA: CBS domain-containing protein [Pyrinomonadaceae bacterium]|nr:CBS domain-containing protein [Pyrinomonadaceae bacterium]